jgi:hypothetical protein
MKKKVAKGFIGMRAQDALANYSDAQLCGLGSVIVTYNEAERRVKELLAFGLAYHGQGEHFASRINGLEGIAALIKAISKNLLLLPRAGKMALPDDVQLLDRCLDDFSQAKSYRDAMVHSIMLDNHAKIGIVYGSKGTMTRVLLSEDALTWLVEYQISLERELRVWYAVFNRFDQRPGDKGDGQDQSPLEQAFQAAILQVRSHQNHRQSLRPVPTLPPEFPDFSKSG